MELIIDTNIEESHSFQIICLLEEHGFTIDKKVRLTDELVPIKGYKKSLFSGKNTISKDGSHYISCQFRKTGGCEELIITSFTMQAVLLKTIRSKTLINFTMTFIN